MKTLTINCRKNKDGDVEQFDIVDAPATLDEAIRWCSDNGADGANVVFQRFMAALVVERQGTYRAIRVPNEKSKNTPLSAKAAAKHMAELSPPKVKNEKMTPVDRMEAFYAKLTPAERATFDASHNITK